MLIIFCSGFCQWETKQNIPFFKPVLCQDPCFASVHIIIIIIMGTAHILRKVLMQKYNSFNTGSNDISTMNSNNRTAATLYSIGT